MISFCVRKGKEKARCHIDLCVMAIEIKIEYSYYSTKRITPVYIVEEELMTLEYSECSTEREDLEFQANAAAALLEL